MRKLIRKHVFMLGALVVFCANLQAKTPTNGRDSIKSAVLATPIIENAATVHAFPELEAYLQQNNLDAKTGDQQRAAEPEFTAAFIEKNFIVPENVQSDRDNAQAMFTEVDRTQNFIDFISPAALVNLPVGMKKSFGNSEVVVGVSKAVFFPDHSELTIFCKINLPQGKTIFFGANNVKLSNAGGIVGNANLVLLGDFQIPINGGNSMITLKGGFDMSNGTVTNLTYASIGCAGVQEIGVAANISFPRSLLTPLDDSYNVISDESVKVQGDFTARVSDWNDILATISLPHPFALRGFEKVAFQVSNATFDMSDTRNPDHLQFDPNLYGDKIASNRNLWRGVSILQLVIVLPPEFKKRGSTDRVTIQTNNFIFDNLGLTGGFDVESDSGLFGSDNLNASGWSYTIDALYLDIQANSVKSGGFWGTIYLPVSDDKKIENSLNYNALFSANNNYIFNVEVNKEINFDLWQAKTTLVAPSSINVSLINGVFRPVANLTGSINLNVMTGDKKDLSFQGIKFQGMKIQTVEPYFELAGASYTDNQMLANFPVSITSIGVSAVGGEVALSAGLNIKLMEGLGDKFNAASTISVVGKVVNDVKNERQTFVYDRLDISQIAVSATFNSQFKLTGSIMINRNHPILGTGFAGTLDVRLFDTSKPQGLKAVAAFGSTTFRYWYVDMLVSGLNIPVGGPQFVITGLGGGASYHMVRTTTGILPSVIPSGLSFNPDANAGLGLRAMALFKFGTKDIAKGDASFEMSFNTSGGLSRLGFYGNATIMPSGELKSQYNDTTLAQARINGGFKNVNNSISDNLSDYKALLQDGQFKTLAAKYSPKSVTPNEGAGSVVATLGIEYDFNNKILDGNFEVRANLAGGLIRGNSFPNDASKVDVAGYAKIHFEPKKWYVLMGTPQNPMSVLLAVGLITVNTGTYFMVGDSLGATPTPPADVARILGTQLQALDYMRNLNDLGYGRGLAFGAKVDLNADISWLTFYAQFKAGIGFDIMVKDYGDSRCVGYNKPIGINGWYANGQAYAYLEGNLGIRVRLLFIQKDISIISAGAAILIQTKLPSPTWFSGQLAARYSVLGGLVSGGFSCHVAFGDNCELVKNNGDAKLNFDFITDMRPEDKAEEVDVLTVPQAVFRYPVDVPFIGDNDASGNPVYYGAKLDAFLLTTKDGLYTGQIKWNNDKNAVFFETKEILAPYTQFTAKVKVSFYKVVNNVWQPLNQSEEKTITFLTGSAPSVIPLSNVEYAYPVPGSKIFFSQRVR